MTRRKSSRLGLRPASIALCAIVVLHVATAAADADGRSERVDNAKAIHSASENASEYLNELSARRRVTTLFKNKQSPRYGVQESYVNTSKGNLTFVVRDLVRRERMPIVVARVYDSSMLDGVDFGPGWVLGLNETLTIKNGLVNYTDSSNSTHTLEAHDGKLVPVEPALASVENGKILRSAGGSIQAILLNCGDVQKRFDRKGGIFRLVQVSTQGGALHIGYNGHLMESISSDHSKISFSRDNRGRIIKIEDDLGRTVSYGYDKNGVLTDVHDRAGERWSYKYSDDKDKQLTSIIDPRDATILEAMYLDSKVIDIRALHSRASFEYNPESTRMTNGLGQKTVFHISDGITDGITDSKRKRFTYYLRRPV
ncbi:MAG: DUF6531 domain-containing protein [Gammaproteobacteria bacterium]|nr:DUF6531 domain-containing protein [Gammaproteobacteria bacterium]